MLKEFINFTLSLDLIAPLYYCYFHIYAPQSLFKDGFIAQYLLRITRAITDVLVLISFFLFILFFPPKIHAQNTVVQYRGVN